AERPCRQLRSGGAHGEEAKGGGVCRHDAGYDDAGYGNAGYGQPHGSDGSAPNGTRN
ncbi:unnamed protein product, partial [Effrenium voratum]